MQDVHHYHLKVNNSVYNVDLLRTRRQCLVVNGIVEGDLVLRVQDLRRMHLLVLGNVLLIAGGNIRHLLAQQILLPFITLLIRLALLRMLLQSFLELGGKEDLYLHRMNRCGMQGE
jgi:hypothetical protein